jgi:hypothetical protein
MRASRAPSTQVMSVVKSLAAYGITVCATIHSPTPYCFNLFDRLLLLLRGEVVYFGPNGGWEADLFLCGSHSWRHLWGSHSSCCFKPSCCPAVLLCRQDGRRLLPQPIALGRGPQGRRERGGVDRGPHHAGWLGLPWQPGRSSPPGAAKQRPAGSVAWASPSCLCGS